MRYRSIWVPMPAPWKSGSVATNPTYQKPFSAQIVVCWCQSVSVGGVCVGVKNHTHTHTQEQRERKRERERRKMGGDSNSITEGIGHDHLLVGCLANEGRQNRESAPKTRNDGQPVDAIFHKDHQALLNSWRVGQQHTCAPHSHTS